MLDSSDKSKSLVCFAHDIFNVITPGQIFTQYYTEVFKGDSLFKRTVFDADGIFSANIPYSENRLWDLSTATQELTWFRQLLTDMGETQERPIDNQGAVEMVVMHIDIRYHFVRERGKHGAIILEYVFTNEMLADILNCFILLFSNPDMTMFFRELKYT